MTKIILVRYGEIVLKGLNRSVFEDKLISNIKKALYGLGRIDVTKSQGRIFIEPQIEDYDYKEAMERLVRVFGIISVSPVWKIDSEMNAIKEYSLEMVRELLKERKENMPLTPATFKVETKRGNKKFPLESPQINLEVGGYILEHIPSLCVDVHNPSFILFIEVREHTYIYSEIIQAHGGLPTGVSGKGMLLLSGGIDSPVAGWMMAKRGVEIDAVHFYSYPYTSERSKDKVIEISRILAKYCFKMNLHIVPFTDIQLEISDKCPLDQMTIIMRRAMMMISERLADSAGAHALITGDCLGQVASQTMQSISVVNAVVKKPVFRPLIGMDKNEVVEIARKIGTFETSILPYEDCCTVFVAKHPQTKPRLEKILASESKLDMEGLIERAIEATEVLKIELQYNKQL